jgi:hypothetical protein
MLAHPQATRRESADAARNTSVIRVQTKRHISASGKEARKRPNNQTTDLVPFSALKTRHHARDYKYRELTR